MLLLLLFPHRKGFAGQSGRSQVALSDVQVLRFFYMDFKPRYYYWEALECLRKLLLTGVAVMIVPGSLIQLVVSLAVLAVYAVAVAMLQPYRTARDNTLALILYSMLIVTLFIGLLLKVKDGYESSGKYEDGFSAAGMTGALVGTVFLVVIAGVGAIVHDTRRALRQPLLQYATGRRIVTLPPLGTASFDLFLSHAQDLGQDQVATIKGILEKLLPSISVFLDVESLDDLHALDQLIIASKTVLIFLTKGCLRRFFVRLEISAAARNGVKTILVQETDERHGCTPLKEHRSDCPDDARKAVFDSQREEILWIRAAHYKLVGIKQIVQRMLVDDSEVLPGLILPGEITLQPVTPPSIDTKTMYHFWLPDVFPWCSQLEACLQGPQVGLTVKRAAPGSFESALEEDCRSVCALLVPLNAHTLEDKGVQQDLWAALQAKLQLVLLHVQEDEYGAVPFGRFFEQCPDRLRNAGLFDELACAWFFNEPHLSIACKTVVLKLNDNKIVASAAIASAAIKAHGAPSNTIVHPISNTIVHPIDKEDEEAESTSDWPELESQHVVLEAQQEQQEEQQGGQQQQQMIIGGVNQVHGAHVQGGADYQEEQEHQTESITPMAGLHAEPVVLSNTDIDINTDNEL
jgi:hypothetical protein